MDEHHEWETTDVVICGCGPTGALLSAYLGRLSTKHIVLEKESGITTDPRGIALDEDGTCMNRFKFIGGIQKDLQRKAFVEMDYATTEGGTGHVGFICHRQPVLEKHLRSAMKASESCQLRSGCTVMDIQQGAEWSYWQYRDIGGEIHKLMSRFFVGADGKTGFTRTTLNHWGSKWSKLMTVNWQIELPSQKTHPQFHLWSLGYTPEDVYDLFFPVNFRFLCNLLRPSICGRFGLPSDRLWRFEFVVRSEEDGDEMATYSKAREVILPYLTHTGERYGCGTASTYPKELTDIVST
ncbi:hypothetical protein EYZ11_010546 [Aspergillus tanneri]|uniref:FAD-binding domain-containing protein n=1 Tax=Aspergillus tanneri TaxID=1220188 RepID=A0A4S3JAH5_9EURO|nr:hypothetical protein EYZ11_010546 [Aspergillus tanneri]